MHFNAGFNCAPDCTKFKMPDKFFKKGSPSTGRTKFTDAPRRVPHAQSQSGIFHFPFSPRLWPGLKQSLRISAPRRMAPCFSQLHTHVTHFLSPPAFVFGNFDLFAAFYTFSSAAHKEN